MIIERKGFHRGEAGYYCYVIGMPAKIDDENGELANAFFAHTRADEYRHAIFVETHRDYTKR